MARGKGGRRGRGRVAASTRGRDAAVAGAALVGVVVGAYATRPVVRAADLPELLAFALLVLFGSGPTIALFVAGWCAVAGRGKAPVVTGLVLYLAVGAVALMRGLLFIPPAAALLSPFWPTYLLLNTGCVYGAWPCPYG